MLRLLGNNAAVNRSRVASRHAPTAVSRRVHPTNTLVLLRVQRAGAHSSFVRLISTNPSSSPAAKSKSNASNVPPPHLPPRKPKIDLKPGPVKPVSNKPSPSPQLLSRNSPRPSGTSPITLKLKLAPKPGSHAESSPSAIELAKQDIAHATALGVLAPPSKDAGLIKRFTHQAFQLFKFYFRGLKAINTHRKQVSVIRARASSGGALPSRAELRFIRTYTQDALKLIPFVIIVLVAEEVIPFIALYAPRMLPSTCVLPGQRDRIAAKAAANQSAAISAHPAVFEALKKEGETKGFVPLQKVSNLGAVCGILGLPAWGPSQLAAWRIRRRLQYISSDDKILKQEAYGRDLTVPELTEALCERGMLGDKLSRDDLRAHLKWWLDTAEGTTEGDEVSRRIMALGLVGSRY
ncbi:hypothetical protein BV22DRAFT_1091891 [Leucogyrophana mollusca]|uniref:Uncharacterized protein n=1 Tax=Leucogyrophana mollusca TaxID=85980 RepID=A0ACB8BE48_9AGAM|nr:hypothetical protein BV22DRAFT_1091891 [Leucogyrophana mollusca]